MIESICCFARCATQLGPKLAQGADNELGLIIMLIIVIVSPLARPRLWRRYEAADY